MCVEIRRVSYDSLTAPLTGSSAEMREKVLSAREAQSARLRGTNIKCNAKMQARELQEFCQRTGRGRTGIFEAGLRAISPESASLP